MELEADPTSYFLAPGAGGLELFDEDVGAVAPAAHAAKGAFRCGVAGDGDDVLPVQHLLVRHQLKRVGEPSLVHRHDLERQGAASGAGLHGGCDGIPDRLWDLFGVSEGLEPAEPDGGDVGAGVDVCGDVVDVVPDDADADGLGFGDEVLCG